ncbi:Uncharacterized protein FWK35_00013700, partial [Aphis craccivora]
TTKPHVENTFHRAKDLQHISLVIVFRTHVYVVLSFHRNRDNNNVYYLLSSTVRSAAARSRIPSMLLFIFAVPGRRVNAFQNKIHHVRIDT